MKSGTTSFHDWLGQHPEIFMSEFKEPGYFVEELRWSSGEEWYSSLFSKAGDTKYVGESSTDYTKLPTYRGVPERILKYSPNARFIYMMRDPIGRTISHYWHNVRNRATCERRELLLAIREDPTYIAYSDYAFQVRPYFEKFGRDSVLTLTMEELLADPEGTLRNVFGWLGINSEVASAIEPRHQFKTPQTVRRKKEWLSGLRHSSLWNRIGPAVPSSIRRVALNLASRPIERESVDARPAIDFLRPIATQQILELERVLGRKFPEWNTLG